MTEEDPMATTTPMNLFRAVAEFLYAWDRPADCLSDARVRDEELRARAGTMRRVAFVEEAERRIRAHQQTVPDESGLYWVSRDPEPVTYRLDHPDSLPPRPERDVMAAMMRWVLERTTLQNDDEALAERQARL